MLFKVVSGQRFCALYYRFFCLEYFFHSIFCFYSFYINIIHLFIFSVCTLLLPLVHLQTLRLSSLNPATLNLRMKIRMPHTFPGNFFQYKPPIHNFFFTFSFISFLIFMKFILKRASISSQNKCVVGL